VKVLAKAFAEDGSEQIGVENRNKLGLVLDEMIWRPMEPTVVTSKQHLTSSASSASSTLAEPLDSQLELAYNQAHADKNITEALKSFADLDKKSVR